MKSRGTLFTVVVLCGLFAIAGCGDDQNDDSNADANCEAGDECPDAGSGDASNQNQVTCEDDEWDDDGECRQCLSAALECSSLVLGESAGESYVWSGAATQSDSIEPQVVLTFDDEVDIESFESAELDVETLTTTQVGEVPDEITREGDRDGRQLTFMFDPDSDWIDGGNPSGLRLNALRLTDTCEETGEQEIGGTFTVLSTDRQYGIECPPEEGE